MNNNLFNNALAEDSTYKIVNKSTIKNPKFSIIITSYNRVEVFNAVDSVKSINNCEIVIVNDGNNEFVNNSDLIKYSKENNITLVTKPKNLFLEHSRNVGVKVSDGEYFAFLDDDDIFSPNYSKYLNKKKINKKLYRFKLKYNTGGGNGPTWMGMASLRLDKWWSYQCSTFLFQRKAYEEAELNYPPVTWAEDRHIRFWIHDTIGVGKYAGVGAIRTMDNESIVRGPRKFVELEKFCNFSDEWERKYPLNEIHFMCYMAKEINNFEEVDEAIKLIWARMKKLKTFKNWLMAPIFLKFWWPLSFRKMKKRNKKL